LRSASGFHNRQHLKPIGQQRKIASKNNGGSA
jgi:hypothetical protein